MVTSNKGLRYILTEIELRVWFYSLCKLFQCTRVANIPSEVDVKYVEEKERFTLVWNSQKKQNFKSRYFGMWGHRSIFETLNRPNRSAKSRQNCWNIETTRLFDEK